MIKTAIFLHKWWGLDNSKYKDFSQIGIGGRAIYFSLERYQNFQKQSSISGQRHVFLKGTQNAQFWLKSKEGTPSKFPKIAILLARSEAARLENSEYCKILE